MLTALYIFIGGGLGSLARFGISRMFSSVQLIFPWSTFISNMLACLILAVVVVLIANRSVENDWIKPLIIIGFCGGFSTFSAFSFETVQLIGSGYWPVALLNILISVATGLGLIYVITMKGAQ